MKYAKTVRLSLLFSLGALLTTAIVSATIIVDERSLEWASRRDLTSQQFSRYFSQYRDQGYSMIDIDVYPVGRALRYSMVWRENRDRRGWAVHRDLTPARYRELWEEYRDRGFRPLDVEGYRDGGRLRWAGIWVENREGFRWLSNRGLTAADYRRLLAERREAGFRLVDLEIYDSGNGIRYAAIWYQNTDGREWRQGHGMTRQSYQAEVERRSGLGFRVVDFESYRARNGQRYAAIWERKPGFGWQTRTDRTERQFANLWRQYRDEGYRLVDFERYRTPDGERYAGIWAENASRFRYARKGEIDDLIESYRAANSIPGISVAIIQNGNVIYRKGFGWADVNDKKQAYGETVYNAASVSKVIGGTLAAKLEEDGRLRDGTTISLDLTRPTTAYLADLPSFHTHSVQQLMSHLGCVAHYRSSPSIANQTRHHSTALSAARSIWNVQLVSGCSVGARRLYSTPAFTLVGAVLESAAGRDVEQLVADELFVPFDLDGLRVQYESSTLPANYDRASPYLTDGTETRYFDNSWKVLGGGIEGHAVDLARFGWKVLNAEIVSSDARDRRLWRQVSPRSRNGLGWLLTADNRGRRTAEHQGTWTGAGSFLRVYRDDGLVIAIMSNRSDPNNRLTGLASSIGNVVLR